MQGVTILAVIDRLAVHRFAVLSEAQAHTADVAQADVLGEDPGLAHGLTFLVAGEGGYLVAQLAQCHAVLIACL